MKTQHKYEHEGPPVTNDSDERVRRTQAAIETARARLRRLDDLRRSYATVWCLLLLPVAATVGWFANQVSLWLAALMIVSGVLVKPITALMVRERRPRTDDDVEYDGPTVDFVHGDGAGAGSYGTVDLHTVPFDEYAAEEREGQP